MLSKWNICYTIGKVLKYKYLKWFCLFDLKLQAKNYDE
jgi:hypothetical protein